MSVCALSNKLRDVSAIALALGLAYFLIRADSVLAQSGTAVPPSDFEGLSTAATTAREAGHAEEAIRDYQSALDLRPDWQEGWWYLGTLQYDADHYREAADAFTHLLNLNSKVGAAWAFLGLCEFESKDYPNSLLHLRNAEDRSYTDDPEVQRVARYHLALLLIRDREFEAATSLLLSEFGSDNLAEPIKVALGMALLRIPLLPDEVDPSRDALIRAAGEAATWVAKHDLERATDSFRKMDQQYPNTPFLHYALGNALASASRYDDAARQFQSETKTTPESPLPIVALVSIAIAQNHAKQALVLAERGVRLAPDSASAHDALAQALEKSGRKSEALAERKKAKELSHRISPNESAPDRFYARESAGRDATAAAENRTPIQGASSNQGNFDDLARRAAAAHESGDAKQALLLYRQALEIQPNWPEGWRRLGVLRYATGDFPHAIPPLKRFVALNPRAGDMWALLGLSEFEVKDYDNALIHLRRGTDLGLTATPDAVRKAKYHLAVLLNRNSEFESAADVLISAVGPSALEQQINLALGIALLRMPVLPDQISPSQASLLRTAGEAASFLAQSKYDRAFAILEPMLRQYPNTPFLHYAYGSALADASRYDDAQVQLQQEIKISPRSALPHVRLASIALRTHRPEAAVVSARPALELDPSSAEAHYLLGRAFLEMARIPDAVGELEIARKLMPTSPEVHFNLARAYAKAKRPEDARQEREEFERVNALVQQRKGANGSQAYGATGGELGLSPPATFAPDRQRP
jgi:tetratricopeptide (TPR) repeat protein